MAVSCPTGGEQDPVGPAAVGPDGGWLRRTVDSPEASDWLTRLLQKREPSLARVTTHSLKHTTLGWLSKLGVYGETQTLLAHHSTGALSTLAYSRDALSGPLRKLESLLHQVRTGKFCPDSTRSGYWKASSGPECAESSLGSWDFLSKDTKDTLQELPGLQRPEGRSLQDTDEPLPPDSHIGHPPKETGGLDCYEREDSPSAAPVDDDVSRPRHLGSRLGPRTLHGRPASSRPCCPRGIHSNILPLATQTALKPRHRS